MFNFTTFNSAAINSLKYNGRLYQPNQPIATMTQPETLTYNGRTYHPVQTAIAPQQPQTLRYNGKTYHIN